MAWWQIALYVLTTVISYRLRQRPEAPRASTLEDVTLPTADASRIIPKLYGTKWIHGANVLWYGDLRTQAITKKGGRKYGLFGPKESITVGYKYYLGMHLGLCHTSGVKTILGINFDDREAWRGYAGDGDRIIVDKPELFGGEEREGGVSGRIDVQLGKSDQTVNEYLAQHLPAPHPGYRGIVGLVMRRFYIGTSTYMKPISVLASSIIDKEFAGGGEWSAISRSALEFEVSGTSPRSIVTDGMGNWVTYKSGTISGTNYLSMYRSTDNGRTWVRTTPLFRLGNVGNEDDVGLAVGRLSNGTVRFLLLGRGSGTSSNLSSFVRYSDDGGKTWSPDDIDIGITWSVTADCAMCWSGSRFVAIRGRVPTGFPDTGKFCITSADGITWVKTLQTMSENFGNTLAIDSDGHGTVIAVRAGSGTSPVGVMKSSNHGLTWEPPQFFSEIVQGIVTRGVLSIACGEYRGSNTTWIAVFGAGGTNRVWNGLISRDNGDTWNYFALPMANNLRSRIRKVVTDKRGNWIAFGLDLMFMSVDDGETWEEVSIEADLNSSLGVFALNLDRGASDGRGNWLFTGFSGGAMTVGVVFNTDGPEPDLLEGDMNPADIIIDALTDKVSGLGQPIESITTGDAFGSFDYARQLFNQEFLGLSFLESSQGRVEEFIRSVQEHADCAVQVDPFTGKWICVPIRDDYDPDEIPVADESVVKELVSFRRPGYGDLINEVTVIYDDRVTGKQQSVTVQNSALLAVQGVVSAQTNTYPGISRADTAMKIASRDLRQLSTPLAEVELTLLPAFGSQLRVGSVFKFDWGPLGITGMILRVVEINYGDLINGEVYVKAMEDVFATAQALYEPPPATAWTPPISEPKPVDASLTMEAPYALLISDILGEGSQLDEALDNGNGFPLAQVEQPTGDSIDYFIHTSVNGGEFSQDGQANFTSRLIIPEVLPAEIESEITFPSDISLVDATVGSLACLNGEWVKIKGKSGQTITLARGIFDTTPRRHFAGASLWLTGDTGFGFGNSAFSYGDSVAVRYTPQTALGVLPISELDETVSPETGEVVTPAIEDSVTFASRASRPYPPGDFKVGGERYPSQMELIAPIEVTWAHRDRISQGEELVEQDEPDIGPEDGTTYRLKVTGISGSTLLDESGITDTSFQLQDEHIADAGIIIELWSVRDGLESFEPQRCQVLTATGLGFALGLNLGGIGLTYEKFYSEASANHSIHANRATLFYCPTNNKVYSNDRVYDADTGEQVKQYTRRQYEDFTDIPGYRLNVIEWFWAEAYLESEDEVVGRLFRYKTYTSVSAGTTFDIFEKTKMKINKTTHEPEAL